MDPQRQRQLIDGPELKGLIDAAIKIGEARRQTLRRMRAALEAGNQTEALKLAASLCGVDQDEPTSS